MAEAATTLPVNAERTPVADKPVPGAWAPVDRLFHEVERLFERFGASGIYRPFARSSLFTAAWPRDLDWGLNPAFDVTERDKSYRITAELPGIDPSNVEIKIVDGVLTVKGEKKDESEHRDAEHHVSERHYGQFMRSFRLPTGIATDNVEAHFENGILTVKLPKSPETQRSERKIVIKGE